MPLLTDAEFNKVFKTKAEYQVEITEAKDDATKIAVIYKDIDANNAILISDINKINIDILKEKETNQKIKYDLGKTTTDINGSSELISNYKYLYNLSYATNFSILLGIGVAGFFLAKNYSSKE